jgi:hypothetical protein
MAIQGTCPRCGKPYLVQDEFAGQEVRCGSCKAPIAVAPAGKRGLEDAAPILARCPSCGAEYECSAGDIGQEATCEECSADFVISAAAASPVPPEEKLTAPANAPAPPAPPPPTSDPRVPGPARCPKCVHEIPPGVKFCPYCGVKLAASPEPPKLGQTSSAPSPDWVAGERQGPTREPPSGLTPSVSQDGARGAGSPGQASTNHATGKETGTGPVYTMKGVQDLLEVFEDRVKITPKGLLGFLNKGLKGTKEIPFSSIVAVQFKEAGSLFSGYFQFTIPGGRESTGGLLAATKDENSFVFANTTNNALARQIKEYIDAAVRKVHAPSATAPATGLSDELLNLAKLREQGILTDLEFQAAKKKLLG